MLTRHSNELMSRLDRVADIGVAEIRRNELKMWFDQDRLTVNVWRDIDEKWAEVLTSEGYDQDEFQDIPLLVAEADGVFALVWGAKLKFDDSEGGADPFFVPISELMKVKERKPRAVTEGQTDAVEYDEYTIRQDTSGTIIVEESGVVASPTRPVLRTIAKRIGIGVLNGNGKQFNTRQLGVAVIAALKARASSQAGEK